MRLEVPADALVVLIGPAGCGKSTFAAAHFAPTQIVSSDACRALVSDDPANAAASADAFALMHFIIDKRLKRGRLTAADATNVHAEKREELLAISRHHKRPAVALVFDLPLTLCQERNAQRSARIPPAGVSAHARALRESLEGLGREGFSAVYRFTDAEDVDTAKVVRTEPSR